LAILLRKTLLANDDAILEFLSMELGKITIFVKKFTKSKKQNEIDFFRIIELEIFQGRNSKSLKNANTFSLFHNFSRDFQSSQIGFKWLDILQKIIPEEEINHDLFKKIVDLFSHYSSDDKNKWNAYFQVQILNFAGFWPRFDQIRDDIYFNPATKLISRNFLPNAISISNLERQTLEFLRRANLAEFSTKKKKLPDNFTKIFKVLVAIENFK
jgi:DNA repair protein RecO